MKRLLGTPAAILLAAAELIAQRRGELAGTIVLCFQPAEEGLGGARVMVAEGMLERFGVERAYGLHLFSQLETGTLGFREGPFYASSDSIEITIEGKGGHGAAPHLSVDPIYVAGAFIVAVQQIVARQIDPLAPAVVTIGAVHAGTIHNVIPSRATLLGTVRAFDADVRANLSDRIEKLAADLDLGDFLDRANGKISAGQKTRVALAKALINRPELLLLDEPTASLDPDTGDLVRSWLERYRAETGCTILLASHNMAEVERLCSHVLMLKQGRVVDRGSPQDLLDRYGRDDLEEVFLDIARDRRSARAAGSNQQAVPA